MEAQLLQGLNVAQRDAVTSEATVLQVLAPPGSGKTKTLTSRVGYLISHQGYNPQNVICCTFTVKASREMRERLRGLIGPDLESKLVMGTFHSICRRILVSYGYLIGIPKGFGIADTTDSNNIVKRIIKRLSLSIEPRAARSKISHHKSKGEVWEDLGGARKKQSEKQQEFMTIFHEYEAQLATSQLLDYDDLLLRCVDLLRAYPACVSNVEALLIDEFQDTNVVQFELMRLLASGRNRITIVGDPDQSIYGFRCAEIKNLRRMKAAFPETIVINLEENYRSTSAVLKLAQDVIEQDTNRPQKRLKATHCHGTQPVLRRLPNPNEEALWIASEIKRIGGMTGGLLQHSDFAILLRSAYLSLLIEKALANAAIPYRMVGGQRFFDRAEVKIVIDYLRTISHPDNNQSLLSIINVPSRKIGETAIAELVKLGEERKLSLWTVVQKVLVGTLSCDKKLTKPAEQELGRLVAVIRNAKQKVASTLPLNVPSTLIDFIVKALDFENYLKKKYKDDHDERLENIKELLTHASDVLVLSTADEQLVSIDGLEQQSSNGGEEVLAHFLANITLSTDVASGENKQEDSRVTISTIHSAKGLEWPAVFIPGLYEGSIPHSRAEDTDEERRLFYVAMTRAQALLTMTFPVVQSRDETESSLTQFLPSTLHHRLASVGPLFCDKVVEDIATILHRPAPSQEDLVKGLENMSSNDSQVDDIWPRDGSRRPFRMQNSGNSTAAEFGRPFGEVLADSQKSKSSTFAQSSSSTIAVQRGLSTTISDTRAFSTSNMTVGFTTASHQMKTATVPDLSRSSSDPLPPKKKPKLSKSTSGHGSIAAFFSKPADQICNPIKSQGPSRFSEESRTKQRSGPALPAKSSFHRLDSDGSIPTELSSHKLNFRSGIIHNRPAPLEDATSSSSKKSRYVALYSSSPPPPDTEEKPQVFNAEGIMYGKENQENETKQNITSLPRHSSSASVAFPVKSYVLSRPANTMHTTSMSSIGQNMGYNATVTSGRKTLGVRRVMNGWDNRKNR